MKQKLIYLTIVFLSAISGISAQSMNAYIKAADKAYDQEDFYSALEFYKRALEFDSTRLDLQYNIAQSARQFNAYSVAAKYYGEIVTQDSTDHFAEASFWLGNVKHRAGLYDDAIMYYQMYLSEYDDRDIALSKRAMIQLESAQWALDQENNIDQSQSITQLDGSVNSPYSEFGALPLDTALLFTSMRFIENEGDRDPKRLISKILTAGESGMTNPIQGNINETNLSIAHTAFNRDKSKVYYTVCKYITDAELKCDLYRRDIDENGLFVNPEMLPFNEMADSITYTQPTIGYDIENDQEFLIFSSNRDGGKGNMDLWRVNIEGDGFGELIPLENVNTPEDEITPFYHSESRVLYYSSNGNVGYGGYDIFSADYLKGDFFGAYNLGLPINSSYNDIYYFLSDDEKTAHFSSNRLGSMYLDDAYEACCYDIYKGKFSEIKIELDVLTFDGLTQDELYDVTVKILDPTTGEVIEEIRNPDGNDHLFPLRKGRDFLVVTEKEGWYPDTMQLSTRGNFPENKITKKVYLKTDQFLLDATVFDQLSLEALNGATLILTDLQTNEIIYSETHDENNQFKVYLKPGGSFQVTTSKSGYSTDLFTIDLTNPPSEQIIKRKIYLQKIDIGEFLPLYLFFDNDQPDPGSRDFYAPSSYSELFQAYLEREDEFVELYVARNDSGDAIEAENALRSFFQNDVKGGYSEFNNFLDILEAFLKQGKTANLSIKGYTSPLARNRYNLALGQRRVSSVKNELARHKGGVFMPYIDSGALTITDISFGEELAPQDVSDRSTDKRNSIYSVEASRERRVEIVRIKIN